MRNLNIKSSGLFFFLLLGGCVSTPDKRIDSPTSPVASLGRPVLSSNFRATCSATVLRPALFHPEEKQILVFDSSPNLTNVPAEIEWHSFTVQVEPARFPNETVPAEYEETTQIIDIERERSELYATPAAYKTLIRKILIQDAHQRWKPDCLNQAAQAAGNKSKNDKGDEKGKNRDKNKDRNKNKGKEDVSCIESVPAKYKEIKVEMVDIPAHTDQRRVPGRTLELKIKKLIKQGKGTGTPIPARYETVKVARIAKPWQIKTTQVPARYETLQVQRMLRPEQVLTQTVICPDALTSNQIRKIQEQLLKNNYKLTITQQLDSPTWQAILQFQRDNGLDTGAITPQTLIKLGLT